MDDRVETEPIALHRPAGQGLLYTVSLPEVKDLRKTTLKLGDV